MITLLFLVAAAICWLIAALSPPVKPNMDALAKCLVTVGIIFYLYHIFFAVDAAGRSIR